jgi:hypothetical protein
MLFQSRHYQFMARLLALIYRLEEKEPLDAETVLNVITGAFTADNRKFKPSKFIKAVAKEYVTLSAS